MGNRCASPTSAEASRSRAAGMLVLLFACVAVPANTSAQQWDSSSVDTVARGVIHRRVVLNRGPWRVNVLQVDLRQPGLSIHGMRANNSFVGRETVRSMLARYRGRGVAVAAVNSDFFNVRTGESENNVVIEGAMSKGVTVSDSPYDTFNNLHSQFGIDWKNHPYIDRFGLAAKLVQGGRTKTLDGLNFRPPDADELVLYTKIVGDSSPADTTRHNTAYLPLHLVSQQGNHFLFRVSDSVMDGGRASTAGGGVLVANGARRNELRAIARRRGVVRVSVALRPDRGNLRTVEGGWPRLVRDGRSVAEYSDIVEGTFPKFSAVRHPRTAVGFSKDSGTVYLVTVDGRRESDSGMSLPEMANTMIQLGAYQAMNFDGGGSATMVIRGKVVNHPSDQAGERPVGSALLIVIGDLKGGRR